MENIPRNFYYIYIIVAFFLSVFYGIRANFVDSIAYNGWYKRTAATLNAIYIFIFHFLGSVLGWLLLYSLIIRISNKCPNLSSIDYIDLLLLLFGFLGITGHLPQSLYGFVKSFSKIAESVANKISS